ncbi:PREDICTED: uncharacterized protein LOC105556271 [Vollenhovia emeryi]|uniref:uncharacterized protein LOC105556271 n=1 Tax=Vollenhovia emeryi TaxID=411798 RepID=UPI0005F3D737|nr:PREDICTED: uncharacterized protein LOC105556271 [Vollenhovia emeryi]
MSDTEDLAALKRQRAVIKASCMRTKNYVDAISAVDSATIAQLAERKLKLEQHWAEYNTVQAKIEGQGGAEDDDRKAFDEAFFSIFAKIRERLSLQGPSRTVAASPAASETSEATSRYLKASLSGEAGTVISSLEISDANYNAAWSLLKERYDNKRVIVQNHIKAILELPSMNKENHIELRQIAGGATKHLHALQALKRPTEHWDDILIHVLCTKIDTLTLREWQSSLSGSELPTSKQFFEFITRQCQMLEATNKSNSTANTKGNPAQSNVKRQAACAATVKLKCNYCKGEHSIYYCKDFLALQVPQRIAEMRSRKFCLNCLRSSTHISNKYTSGGCKVCQAKHNTLLHIATAPQQAPATAGPLGKNSDTSKSSDISSVATTHATGGEGNVILSTAIAQARDHQGVLRPCRILLDCGSQANFISQGCLTRLGLVPRSLSVTISGVNGTVATATQAVKIEPHQRQTSCHINETKGICLSRNIKLADPQFHISSEIDLLIGAEIFWDLLCVGQIPSAPWHPKLQKTRLGWILAGRMTDSKSPPRVHSFHASITNEQLHDQHDQLSRFWQLDDGINNSENLTPEEKYCEQHFLDNVYQNPQGRYVVKLPVKNQLIDKLGESRSIATSRLKGLEKRFKRQPELKREYNQFIKEYISLGHMRKMDSPPDESAPFFYLPHHCVFKVSNQTSKIRVVFDASCKTAEGLSLNDALMVGPVVPPELTAILIRFRFFTYVFSADVIKMYRQVLVDPSQTRLQRILWRDDPDNDMDTYELLTITYGTSSASYLAIRTLNHHSDQYASRYPIGSRAVKRSVYVDDFLSGADTLQEAMVLRDALIELLKVGSFELSKWASNCPELLQNIRNRDGELIALHDETDSSILGIQWNQVEDALHFAYDSTFSSGTVSKRAILSEVSRLFDPLGLLGPVIVIAKLILQSLWKAGIHWDESVPQELHTSWLKLKSQLPVVNQLQITRCAKFHPDPQFAQLHGFCDASQNAYGACIYVRTKLETGEYRSELLCSKSHVASLKAVSLPRLELSAAVLLAQLITKVRNSLDSPVQAFLWSNSTITLNWIASSSRNWSVFVPNRIGEVQRLTQISD